MRKVHLDPKYEKLKKELILKKKDPFAGKGDFSNAVVEISAEMVALGLQLLEKDSDNKTE